MLKRIFASISKAQNTKTELEQFQTRLKARIFLLFIYITQVGQRTYFITNQKGQTQSSIDGYETSFPFLGALIVIVLGEVILYQKLGVRILKYANFISAFFFLVATAEWMVTLYAGLLKSIQIGQVHGYNIPAIFGFTSFSWRIMMQAFIVQTWYLRSVAPTAAYLMTIGYTLHLTPKWTAMILVRGLLQIVYVICIWYFEQKINLKLLLSNLHQEKWLEMNQFILNNVPEKIAIIDWDGNMKFMSDYLKTFIDKYDLTSGFTSLCKEIKDLEQIHNSNNNISVHNSSDRSGLERSSATVGEAENAVKIQQNIERFDSLEELLSTFRTLFKNKNPSGDSFLIFNGKFKAENSSEKSIEVKISLSREQYSNSKKQFLILLLRDTTQRDQVIRLEASNKYKDQLLASVSHELRTPLNGSINLLEASLCSDTIDTRTKEDFLMPALNSSKFLLHLINDILDMSQIKAEKLRLTFQRIDPRETIINAVKLLTLNAQMKGISLEVELQDDLPNILSTDHVRFSQIILNLIHNSIKFTQVGFVKISAEPVENMPWIKIIIQDSGIGMTREEIKQLFSVFTHIESRERESLNPTGAGLGLSIAHNLAKILGPKATGGIKVSSTPGQGSSFTFFIENREAHSKRTKHIQARTNEIKQEESLTLESSLHPEIGEEPAKYKTVPSYISRKSIKFLTMSLKLESEGCKCPKILIIDDDAFNMLAYKSVFRTLGADCDCAYNGKAGIEKFLERVSNPCGQDCKPFSLIFMDQEMPEMNGVETVIEIKGLQAQGRLPEVPIIGCTAHKDGQDIENFLRSGINRCIEKPISVTTMKQLLEEHKILNDK